MKNMAKKALLFSVVMALVFTGTLFAGGGQQAGGGSTTHAVVFKSTGNPFG